MQYANCRETRHGLFKVFLHAAMVVCTRHGNKYHLCVEEGQTPDSVEGDQHFDQKLFMLRFQRQSETIDYTVKEETERIST